MLTRGISRKATQLCAVAGTALLWGTLVPILALSGCADEPCQEIRIEPMTVHANGQEPAEANFEAVMTYEDRPVAGAGINIRVGELGQLGEWIGLITTDENGVATGTIAIDPKWFTNNPPKERTGYSASGDLFKRGNIGGPCFPDNAYASLSFAA